VVVLNTENYFFRYVTYVKVSSGLILSLTLNPCFILYTEIVREHNGKHLDGSFHLN
jgi:hypothetical protein